MQRLNLGARRGLRHRCCVELQDEEAADLAEGTRGLTTHCFSVGRFCKIRVSTYHALFHYRTHLARWLRSRLLEVRQEGVE